jgi:hypothetical protein
MNIQAMKEAAQIAVIGEWYTEEELRELLLDSGSSAHIANCDPGTILKLLAVVEAACAYVRKTPEQGETWATQWADMEAALKELE